MKFLTADFELGSLKLKTIENPPYLKNCSAKLANPVNILYPKYKNLDPLTKILKLSYKIVYNFLALLVFSPSL